MRSTKPCSGDQSLEQGFFYGFKGKQTLAEESLQEELGGFKILARSLGSQKESPSEKEGEERRKNEILAWLGRLMVRTLGSQPRNRGSTPLRATSCIWSVLVARHVANVEEAVRFRSDALIWLGRMCPTP